MTFFFFLNRLCRGFALNLLRGKQKLIRPDVNQSLQPVNELLLATLFPKVRAGAPCGVTKGSAACPVSERPSRAVHSDLPLLSTQTWKTRENEASVSAGGYKHRAKSPVFFNEWCKLESEAN